jgi:hypothetical protein
MHWPRLVLLLVTAAAATAGELRAQDLTVEIHTGFAVSSRLAREPEPAGDGAGVATLAPAPAPVLGFAVRTPLRPRLEVEAAAGWTPTRLEGSTAGAEWTAHDLSVLHGVVALRRLLGERLFVQGGIGAIHYSAPAEGLFQDGGTTTPVAEAAGGGEWHLGGRLRLVARLWAQYHRFGTPALREAGGEDGGVARAGIRFGAAFGEARP